MKLKGVMQVDKRILNDYIDACENIKETERHIKELQRKKKEVIQTNVSGSNPEYPYEKKHFVIQGSRFTYNDDVTVRIYEKTLEERKISAESLRQQVEEWLNTIPNRMQRIIRYKVFEGMTWEQVAVRIGRKATGDSVKKEFYRFIKENE